MGWGFVWRRPAGCDNPPMSSSIPRGATIRVFLVDGTPQGLRVVDRPGWTGSCLAFSRSEYAEARGRPEVRRTGVYILLGPDEQGPRESRVYIGEADEVRTRLDAHQKEKDFWTDAFVLTTTDESLNKAHARYIEARLIGIAAAADNAKLDNGTAPPSPRLSEPETADMEGFLENALMLMPLLGVDVFDKTPASDAVVAEGQPLLPRLFLKTLLTDAQGQDDPRGFLVFEGGLARREARLMGGGYERLRQRLIDDGLLVPDGTEQLRLTRSFVFDSPSAAASVLSGGSKNGRTEWRNAAGRTLKQIQEATAAG